MKQIIIEVDINDGDYITSINKINEDDLKIVKKVASLIKEFKPYKTKYISSASGKEREWSHSNNWPSGDLLREDLGEKSPEELYNLTDEEVEVFSDYLPWSEYGLHTIISIKIAPVVEYEVLF